jgi:hypothetical protein
MIPVPKDDGELLVVNVGERLVIGVNDKGSTKSIGILIPVMRVPPVRAGLSRSKVRK